MLFKFCFWAEWYCWLSLSYWMSQVENIKGHMKDSTESIENDEVNKFTKDISVEEDPINIRRRDKVKDAMLHAWTSYEKYAWGKDELKVFLNIFSTFWLIH